MAQSKLKMAISAVRSIYLGTQSSFAQLGSFNQVDFGVTVNEATALKFTAVYAAIKILAENVASLPKSVKVLGPDGFEDAFDNPVYSLLKNQPNSYTDNFTFWFSMISTLEGNGNAIAIIKRDKGVPVELHQINPDFVKVSFVNGRKLFDVRVPDDKFSWLNKTYQDYDVIHLMLFSLDGLWGIDPISYNSAAIGRGIATQLFSAEFYRKGGNIKGVLETDQNLGDSAFENFKKHFDSSKNFDTPILEYGIKYKSIGISPIAAQLIQSETLSIQDIARIFSIPPHLLAELSHATFSNIEQQNIFFAIYSLRPLCKRIEQQLENKLFTDKERGIYSIKFDLKGMMRGDDAGRSAYYASGINNGWLTPNEARKEEGLTSLPGLDRPRMPLNFAEIDENGNRVDMSDSTSAKESNDDVSK